MKTLYLLFLLMIHSMTYAGSINTFTDRSQWDLATSDLDLYTEEFNTDVTVPLSVGINDLGQFQVYFETYNNQNPPGPKLVNFTGTDRLLINDYLQLNWSTTSPHNTLAMELHFNQPISAFAADFVAVDNDNALTISFPDNGSVNIDNVLGEEYTGFIGWVLGTSVTKLSFSATSSEGFFMDNLQFESVSTVPIPASFWLLIAGLVCLLKRKSTFQ